MFPYPWEKKKVRVGDKYLTHKNVLPHQQLVICLELLSLVLCFSPTFPFPRLGTLKSVCVSEWNCVISFPTIQDGMKRKYPNSEGFKTLE